MLCLIGKIGTWPFAEVVQAKRASKKRHKGTPELKPIISVTKAYTRRMIIDKIIPQIVNKWPRSVRDGKSPTVFIQQDNAGPHIGVDNPEFRRAATDVTSLQIKLIMQPQMRQDLNVLDLFFFFSIQSLHYRKLCKTYEELRDNVFGAFDEYKVSLITNLWLILQTIYNEVLKAKGNNNYKLPHLCKQKLRKKGRLPENTSVCNDALHSMMEHRKTLDQLSQQQKEVNALLENAEHIAGV